MLPAHVGAHGEHTLEGESHRRLVAGRPIVGATVRVRSLETARRALADGGVYVRQAPAAPRSVFVAPADARGLWLELVEGR